MLTPQEKMARARAEYPLLASCVYMNSNSTGAFPRAAKDVLDAYWRTLETWRDEAWERWWVDLHAYADEIAALVGGPPGSVVTDANMSTLLARVLSALDFRDRPRVVTTDLEFPTTGFLVRAFERYGAAAVFAPSVDGVRVDEERLLRAIDERTRLVCVSHATYTTGALLDLGAVVRRAREVGALVAVDAYQSVGVVPIDVTALDVDFLLGGAHKWLSGSIESGFLYVRPALTASLRPAATGWMASADPLSFGPATEYASSARRFAGGTPLVLPALMSRPGLDIVRDVGMPAIRAVSLARTSRILARAEEAGLAPVSPKDPDRRGGIVCLRFAGAERVTTELKRRGFVCSYRGGLRIAPHFYNTDDEVDALLDALTPLAREAAR